ncbi:MAG: hypothetical protein GY898_34485 [Proteobacteria bacterium]|nr:hypothetical protein [Pseudomonadota bacterium]
MAVGSHLMMRLKDGRVIANNAAARCHVAESMLTVGRPFEVVVFRLVDDHLHAVTMNDGPAGRELGRRVEISLQHRLKPGVGFSEVYVKPVVDQRHLRNLFWYCLGQEKHHGVELDPLFEASNLPDLLGWRTLGGWTIGNVRRYLPRVGRERLLEQLPVMPAVAPFDVGVLRASVGAAACVIAAHARHERARAARCAAVYIVDGSAVTLATAIGIGSRSVERLKSLEPEIEMVRAVEGQLALRTAWRQVVRAREVGR